LLTGGETAAFGATGDAENDLLSTAAVHPMRAEAVRELLAKDGAAWQVVEQLVARELLKEIEYDGQTFYVRRFAPKRELIPRDDLTLPAEDSVPSLFQQLDKRLQPRSRLSRRVVARIADVHVKHEKRQPSTARYRTIRNRVRAKGMGFQAKLANPLTYHGDVIDTRVTELEGAKHDAVRPGTV
jgi:hypothetical protein